MAFLSTLFSVTQVTPPNQWFEIWELLILNVFSFITNYGWRIILFTVLLKLLIFPLDVYQRVMMRKNQKITERIKPQMEKLQQQYGNDKQAFAQKQMELNKREGFSYFSSCLPMIVTLVIFFWLFSGLNNISQYMNMKQYVELYDEYNYTKLEYEIDKDYWDVERNDDGTPKKDENGNYIIKHGQVDGKDTLLTNPDKTQGELNSIQVAATDTAQTAVLNYYETKNKESFLWIKNIWSADVPWTKPIKDFGAFKTAAGKYAEPGKKTQHMGLSDDMVRDMMSNVKYDAVMEKLKSSDNNRVNGFLILPILSIGLSFLSQFITSKLQKNSGQMNATGGMATSMKVMMFMMPLMMGFFALTYTSAFTLYIVINSTMTILLNLTTTGIMKLLDIKKERENITPDGVMKYGRPDPNETAGKDKKKKDADAPVRYGRPDFSGKDQSDGGDKNKKK